MGTWEAGPFGNDTALDFVGDVVDQLMVAVDEFAESPEIDETFDPAFAAIALLNEIMRLTPTRPWRGHAFVDGGPIRDAMVRCFDEQIDGMEPDPEFKRDQRAVLVQTLETFVQYLSETD